MMKKAILSVTLGGEIFHVTDWLGESHVREVERKAWGRLDEAGKRFGKEKPSRLALAALLLAEDELVMSRRTVKELRQQVMELQQRVAELEAALGEEEDDDWG